MAYCNVNCTDHCKGLGDWVELEVSAGKCDSARASGTSNLHRKTGDQIVLVSDIFLGMTSEIRMGKEIRSE